MTLRHHSLSDALLSAIGAGGGGIEAINVLTQMQYSRNRLFMRLLLDHASHAPADVRAAVEAAYQNLADVEDADPAAVRRVLCYPTVSAWLAATAAAAISGEREPAALQDLALVSAAASVRARRPARLPYPGRDYGYVLLPSLGQAYLPGVDDVLRVHTDDETVALARGGRRTLLRDGSQADDTTRWIGLPEISVRDGGRRLTMTVDGPGWAWLPPARRDRRVQLRPASIDHRSWKDRVTSGWHLLAEHHPAVADEVRAAITVLVPLALPAGARTTPVTATFVDAFGAVAMSLPPDDRSLAVALAHEVQHAKLATLMHFLPLVRLAPGATFYAPWRPDPRPLGALLHGAYAHLGVAAFWLRQSRVATTRDDALAAEVEFARWRAAVRDATATIVRSGLLTSSGELIVSAMRKTLHGFLDETVSPEAATAAAALAREHRLHHARS